MEIARYLNIIRRRWPIILVAFLVTTGATFYFVLPQPNVYESTGTFVVGPRAVNAEESVGALDTLIRGEAINGTYATIARSKMVRDAAEAAFEPSLRIDNMTVSAEVVTGTNILSISVQGTDPESAQALAGAIGAETVDYVDELDEAYRLQPLDEPTLPQTPVAPKRSLTILMGIIFGLVLGMSLALLIDSAMAQLSQMRTEAATEERRRVPAPSTRKSRGRLSRMRRSRSARVEDLRPSIESPTSPIDLHATLQERSLIAAFRKEMERTTFSDSTFSLGILTLSKATPAAVREHPALITTPPSLCEGDAFSQIEDRRFAVVMADLPLREAKAIMTDWEAAVWNSLYSILRSQGEKIQPGLLGTAVCSFEAGTFVGDRDAIEIAKKFKDAPSSIDEADIGVGALLDRAAT